MSEAPDHSDFLIRDLWHWLSQTEFCICELQDGMLSMARIERAAETTELIFNGTCLVSSLEGMKLRLRREIVLAARDFCLDSGDESFPLGGIRLENIGVGRDLMAVLSCLKTLIEESKSCTSILRSFCRGSSVLSSINSTQLSYKSGKWVKTHQGQDLIDSQTQGKNAYGLLKSDFDKQTRNILALENERNEQSVEIERLEAKLADCSCMGKRDRKRRK